MKHIPELDLHECGLRIEWANQDGVALSDLVAKFRDERSYTTWLSQDGGRWYWRFLRLAEPEYEELVLGQIARLIGSMLDHFRATLNYLTYQVALASLREYPSLHGLLRPESVEFPIFNDPDTYRTNNRVKKLPEEYRAALEAVQPYHGNGDALWVLHELAREYRHRLVHPAALVSIIDTDGNPFSGVFPPSARDVDIVYDGGPLRHGDNICSFVTDIEFDPRNYPLLVMGIGVDHPLCKGRNAVTLMSDICQAVVAVLNMWGGDWYRESDRTRF